MKAYKYRFYPTEKQKVLLAKNFGCCRFVYNHFLSLKKSVWEEKKESLSYGACSSKLVALKKEYPWLQEVSSVCIQQSLRHLQQAFTNFFKLKTHFPRFKRRDSHQSCSFMKNAFTYRDGKLALAKMGEINVRWSRSFSGEITSLTVKQDRSGRYFVSLLVDEKPFSLPSHTQKVGLDLGIAQMVTDDQGNKISSPHFLDRLQKKIRRSQQSLSRKKIGSTNRKTAKHLLAILHAKVHDRRLDFLHKLSTKLVSENQVIVVESLGVAKMLKGKRLARRISDASWSTFVRLLEYKCEWAGRTFLQVGKYFPSSKRCHGCHEVKSDLSLSERSWCCSHCGIEHDRDVNAAKNILEEGLRLLLERVPRGSRDLKPVESV